MFSARSKYPTRTITIVPVGNMLNFLFLPIAYPWTWLSQFLKTITRERSSSPVPFQPSSPSPFFSPLLGRFTISTYSRETGVFPVLVFVIFIGDHGWTIQPCYMQPGWFICERNRSESSDTVHYALHTQLRGGSVTRISWKIGERERDIWKAPGMFTGHFYDYAASHYMVSSQSRSVVKVVVFRVLRIGWDLSTGKAWRYVRVYGHFYTTWPFKRLISTMKL